MFLEYSNEEMIQRADRGINDKGISGLEILIHKQIQMLELRKDGKSKMGELSHLDELEAEAIYIIREVAAECEKPVMLYSIGKRQLHYVAFCNESILS